MDISSLRSSDITTVIHSWERVKEQDATTLLSLLIFGKFFELAPHAMDLYPFECATAEALYDDLKFQRHSSSIVETFDLVVTTLMDLEREYLVKLGERHKRYPGVSPDYFGPFGAAVLFSLEQMLSDTWDAETQEAWIQVIGFIAGAMSEGMLKTKAAPKQQQHPSTSGAATPAGENWATTGMFSSEFHCEKIRIARTPSPVGCAAETVERKEWKRKWGFKSLLSKPWSRLKTAPNSK